MDQAIEEFNRLIKANFINPSVDASDVNLDLITKEFANAPLWLSRLLVVQYVLNPTLEVKNQVLGIYAQLFSESKDDFMLAIEAARAAAVFEECDALIEYLDAAQKACDFSPNLTGVKVKYSAYQENAFNRMACLIEDKNVVKSKKNSLENIGLRVDNDRFVTPEFVDKSNEYAATSLLSDVDYLLLLLNAKYMVLNNPAADSTVVNEQSLPYIRRITETAEFNGISDLIAVQALYSRTNLELKDINELERGALQLLSLSKAMHNGSIDDLNYFHQTIPLSWIELDEMAARRLVAMSDFANAVPLYKRLNKPIDLAICYAAVKKETEAMEVLKSPEIANTPEALLLRGEIGRDLEALQLAWDQYQLPKAKLRLAQTALAQKDYAKALGHIEAMLEVSPTNHEALLLASACVLALQNWDKSVLYLRRALSIKDDDASSWADLATAFLQNNQPSEAHHAILQALRVNQNSQPDLPTWTNYIALSAQLGKWEDVIIGLARLSTCGSAGSAQYIVKLSGILPRLVESQLKHPYTGSGTQKQLQKLFDEELPAAIPKDDPMMCRLNALIKMWSKDYQQGLKSFQTAINHLLQLGSDDPRIKARLQMYAKEYVECLEKYGDKEGRIEGSKAFPQWRDEVKRVSALIN